MENQKIDIYISFCHKDNTDKWISAIVDLIRKKLTSSSEYEFLINFDEDNNFCDNVISSSNMLIISKSRIAILFISKSFFNCKYCLSEWRLMKDDNLVLPVLIDEFEFDKYNRTIEALEWDINIKKYNPIDIINWSLVRGPAISTKAFDENITQICDVIVNHLKSAHYESEYEDLSASSAEVEFKLSDNKPTGQLENLLCSPIKSFRIDAIQKLLVLASQSKRPSKYLNILKNYALNSNNDAKTRSIAINCFSKIIIENNLFFLRDISKEKLLPTRMRVTAIKALPIYSTSIGPTKTVLLQIILDPVEPDSIINSSVKSFLKLISEKNFKNLSPLINHSKPKVRLDVLLFLVKYLNPKNIKLIESLIYDDDQDIKIIASYLYSKKINII